MLIKIKEKLTDKTVNKYLAATVTGKEFNISDAEFNDIKAGIPLNISGVNILIDDVILPDTENEKVPEIVQKLSEDFHKSEDVIECIQDAFDLGHNVLLYGPGGYGKSEITIAIFNYWYEKGIIDERPFVKTLSEGTTSEDLWGSIDLKAMKNNQEIRYNIKESFMNHKYVIFEEMFDAHPSVVSALKDILTSGQFRNGAQVEDIRTKMVIGLTNKSKYEFATNDSTRALADRFAYTMKVDWTDAIPGDYVELFAKVRKDRSTDKMIEYTKLANLIHAFNNGASTANHISIRTAIAILKTHLAGKSLRFIEGLDHTAVELYKEQVLSKGANRLSIARSIVDSFFAHLDATGIISSKFMDCTVLHQLGAELVLNKLTNNDPDFVPQVVVETRIFPKLSTNPEFSEYLSIIENSLIDLINKESDSKLKEQITIEFSKISLLTYDRK